MSLIDNAQDIRQSIIHIEDLLNDLSVYIERLDDAVFDRYGDEEIFDNIQSTKSSLDSVIKEYKRLKSLFEDVYDDIHYYEFEKMKEG